MTKKQVSYLNVGDPNPKGGVYDSPTLKRAADQHPERFFFDDTAGTLYIRLEIINMGEPEGPAWAPNTETQPLTETAFDRLMKKARGK